MLGKTISMAVVAIIGIAGTAAADADSLTDYFGPREISIGETMRANAVGALSTTLNPAGLALNRQLVFDGSYGYRPDDGASAVSVSACDSTVEVPGCFYYRYFVAEPEISGSTFRRRVHEFGITGARALTPRLMLGINAHYFDYDSDLSDDSNASGFTGDAGFIFRATDSISVAAVGYNLVSADSEQHPRAAGAGISVAPASRLHLGLDAVWNLDVEEGQSTGRYGIGAQYFIQSADQQSGYPIRAGMIHDRQLEGTYVTGGLGFGSVKMGIDVGARKQVDGGDELMVQAGLRLFGPHVP